MLRESENKKEETNTEESNNKDIIVNQNVLKLIGIVVVFIFMIVFMITSGNGKGKKKIEVYPIETEEVIEVSNKIEKNYSLEVTQTINGKSRVVSYYTDGKNPIEFYEDSVSEYEGYVKYKGNIYGIQSDITKTKKLKEIPSFINDKYLNVELLKKALTHCTFTSDGRVKLKCQIKLSDYISEYNSIYNTEYEVLEDETMTWDLVCFSTHLSKVIIDYKSINKIVNKTDDDIKYEMKFSNIGTNDFT